MGENSKPDNFSRRRNSGSPLSLLLGPLLSRFSMEATAYEFTHDIFCLIQSMYPKLQGHMMWLQRQESFKQKFGDANPEGGSEKPADELLLLDDCDCELN